MSFIRREAWLASCKLGKEKGVFPEFESNRDVYESFFEVFDLVAAAIRCGAGSSGYTCLSRLAAGAFTI